MHMKQRGQRHVNIAMVQPAPARHRAKLRRKGQRVQHQLAVGIADPLWVTRGAGGIKQRRPGVFVEIGKVDRVCHRHQRLILPGKAVGQRGIRPVGQQDKFGRAGKAGDQRHQQWQKILMHQNGVITGMVDGVQDLFRRQPHVDGVQRRPRHRNGEETFQIAVAVIIHHRDGGAWPQPQPGQRATQTAETPVKGGIGHGMVAVADRLIPACRQRGMQQLTDQKRIVIGGRHGILRLFCPQNRLKWTVWIRACGGAVGDGARRSFAEKLRHEACAGFRAISVQKSVWRPSDKRGNRFCRKTGGRQRAGGCLAFLAAADSPRSIGRRPDQPGVLWALTARRIGQTSRSSAASGPVCSSCTGCMPLLMPMAPALAIPTNVTRPAWPISTTMRSPSMVMV